MIDKAIEFLKDYDGLEDKKHLEYAKKINGLIGPASVEILNKCVSLMNAQNCYLEVGTFQGMSLIGASLNNNHITCYGVENFSEKFKDNWEKYDKSQRSNQFILEKNLKEYGTNCKVFYQDYRKFFHNRTDINGQKVEIYFYDGPHSYEHQLTGILLAIPVLADKAIVFVDDYNCPNVPKAIDKILNMDRGFTEIKNWVFPYEDFREGFVALEYNKGLND